MWALLLRYLHTTLDRTTLEAIKNLTGHPLSDQGSAEAVQQAADAVMVGGALDSIIDAIEFVRKKSESGSCTLQ